ncbi:hypothetical protein AB7M35_001754 [Amorphus suaedae]
MEMSSRISTSSRSGHLAPPCPVVPEHADAWMVRPSCEGVLARTRGKVRCANALMRPELWA